MTMMHRALALAALCHAAHGRLAAVPDLPGDVVDVPVPYRCQQTRKCASNAGSCVPPSFCVPGPTVACEPEFCRDPRRCTCMMGEPCEETEKCTANGGKCVKNCKEIPNLVKCADICDPDSDSPHKCMCEIRAEPPCTPSFTCLGYGGECVKDCVPSATVDCKDVCTSKGCMCKIKKEPTNPPTSPPTNPPTKPPTKPPTNPPTNPIDCTPTRRCVGSNGSCVPTASCDPAVAGIDCQDFCGDPDLCTCQVCKDTDECRFNRGECVPPDACDPRVSKCEPHFCGDPSEKDCVCKIDIVPPPCKDVNQQCARARGECVTDCEEIEGFRTCDEKLCSEGWLEPDGCQCKIEKCQQTRKCEEVDGDCVPTDECDPAVSICDPRRCADGSGDDCVCQIKKDPEPCIVSDLMCAGQGGTCTDDCDATVSDCDESLCGSGDLCACETCQRTEECVVNDGTCVPKASCVESLTVKCEDHFCGDGSGDKCTCEIKADPRPCKDFDDKCALSRGECVKDCKPIFGVRDCIRDYCADAAGDPEGCQCQVDKCQDVNQMCREKRGVCKVGVDCVAIPGSVVCDPDLCGSGDLCVCEYNV